MQEFWPQDTRFKHRNFGKQPIWLILQALEHGKRLRDEVLHYNERGVARLTSLTYNINRGKGDPAKPSDFYDFAPEHADGPEIPDRACNAFFSLIDDELLPVWVVSFAPIQQLRKYRTKAAIAKPRAWISENLIILLPRISKDKRTLKAALAFNNGVSGLIELRDADSGTIFTVDIPPEQNEICWTLEPEFTLKRESDVTP